MCYFCRAQIPMPCLRDMSTTSATFVFVVVKIILTCEEIARESELVKFCQKLYRFPSLQFLLATRCCVETTEFLRGNGKKIEEGWSPFKAMREIDWIGRSGATAGEYGAYRCQRGMRRRRKSRKCAIR